MSEQRHHLLCILRQKQTFLKTHIRFAKNTGLLRKTTVKIGMILHVNHYHLKVLSSQL